MSKALNISYFISKAIFVSVVLLFVALAIRHLIGIEYYDHLNDCHIKVPIDFPIMMLGIFTFLFSLFYYPLLLIFMILYLILRNKTTIIKTQSTVSIKRYFILCLLTFLMGFIIFGMSDYLWGVSSVCN